MKCLSCPYYESRGMTTGDAWNRCNITGAEYFFTQDDCDLVDKNGRDNGKFDESMKQKATYLLPIWVDIHCHGDPKDILIDLNEKLTEFFEKYGDAVAKNSNSIDIQWSVNQHIKLK